MPFLHVIARPNDAGKPTHVARLLQPVTHLPFVNSDVTAAQRLAGSGERARLRRIPRGVR